MRISNRPQHSKALSYISLAMLSLVIITPTAVWADGGHGGGSEFQGTGEPAGAIKVNAQTAKQLGIKVESARRQQLAVGIKSNGQIETLPSKKVEVTTPIQGAKVVDLLVEPGASVTAGQPIAILYSPDLVELRVTSQEKRAEAQADLQQAQANLKLAQQNYEQYSQIAAAKIAEAQSQLAFTQEQYDKDNQLAVAGALPRRNALESQTQLAQAKAQFTEANSRRDVIEAEAELKRAQSAVEVAQTRIRLSDSTYQTRLQQLGTRANNKGLVTVTAPISGKVADREVTLGQSFQDAGGKLMTIVNDSRVFATANIYEKDLDKVKTGQRVIAKVASMPDRSFSGRIATLGSVVEGETRVVPVKAELNNPSGELKPGMFAQLEIVTSQTTTPILAIKSTAVVEANGKQLVFVQKGNAFQPVEVTLGQTSGGMVEVKSGLVEGNLIVTQRAPQLYAQSLRGGSEVKEGEHKEGEEAGHQDEATGQSSNGVPLPWWLVLSSGGVIAAGTFIAGAFWANRRTQRQVVLAGNLEYAAPDYETEPYLKNSKQPTAFEKVTAGEHDNPHQPHS